MLKIPARLMGRIPMRKIETRIPVPNTRAVFGLDRPIGARHSHISNAIPTETALPKLENNPDKVNPMVSRTLSVVPMRAYALAI